MASSFDKSLRSKIAGIPSVGVLVGTFVSTDGSRATVDAGGGRIPADFAGYLPDVGEQIRILFVDGTATILGPAKLKPGRGTVTAPPSGNLVPVTTAAGDFTLPYAAGLTLSAGQVVKLGAANDGMFVYAVMSTSPVPADPPPPPSGSGGGPQTQTFRATDSGSFNGSRWWTNEVYASDNNDGAFFYGSVIADTIPDGATITSVEIYISIKLLSFQAPNIGWHNAGSKPGGAIAYANLTPTNIGPGFIGLPTSFGDYLKANVGGIYIHQGGYSILHSLVEDPQSGALRIRWTT